jgi:uncharacterized protein
MIDFIKNYTKNVCNQPNNLLSPYFFNEHIIVVSEYAERLSNLLNGDIEIVKISSYLHDISAILDIKTLATHNIDSSGIAESILFQNNYPGTKIERIKQCIIKHSLPLKIEDGSIEEVCLSNADAISQIVNPSFWLYFSFKVRGLDYIAAKTWYLNKIDSNWNLLIEPAKKLVEEKYSLVKKALE